MSDALTAKKCVPCEGGVPMLNPDEAKALQQQTPEWEITEDNKHIRRSWTMKNFTAAMDFFNKVCEVAEGEGHHPDLHLERYRYVTIDLWTHAIGGLSENDFIVAAKIDQLPVELKED